MSFREIMPPTKPGVGTGVKATCSKRKDGPLKLSLSLAESVLAQIGATPKSRFRIAVGEGESMGLVKVSADPGAPFTGRPAPRGSSVWFSLGEFSWLPATRPSPAWCKWQVTEGGKVILVTLSSWFPRPQAESRRMLAPVAEPAAARGRSVTSALMGDPPPGRPKA
jgi:hypothetical protein